MGRGGRWGGEVLRAAGLRCYAGRRRLMAGARRGLARDASGQRSGGGRPRWTVGGGAERRRSASVAAIGPATSAVGGVGVGFVGGVNLCECEV
jgi:hypothetical protein